MIRTRRPCGSTTLAPPASGRATKELTAASRPLSFTVRIAKRFRAILLRELPKLAGGRSERLLAVLDVASGNRERHRSRAVLIGAHEDHLVAVGDRDHRGEIPSAYPEEPVDFAAVGQRDPLLADLHPRRARKERAPRQCAPGTHQDSLNVSSLLRSSAKPSAGRFGRVGSPLPGCGNGLVRIQARFLPQGATG